MQRFFVSPEQVDEKGHSVLVTGPDVNHIRKVLRLKEGDEIWISSGGSREYHCSILSGDSDAVKLRILYAQEPEYELPSQICLFQGLPKSDKMEWIIQKAAELGASRIVPVRMKRCVMKLDDAKAEKKIQRWQQIAESAAKQSRRMRIPKVEKVYPFDQAVREAAGMDLFWLPYELSDNMIATKEALSHLAPGKSLGIFIGPEGGFEEEEVLLAKTQGAELFSLGHRILRTETAGMTLLSVAMIQLELMQASERNVTVQG
ncbi:MAG: 16S rRNA (uracil(1498)-N(3))-methyltransferase [Blautia sp.]|nr:16S rRNA (uracil(1498)-N(3))-methyltransferase [Blautia sp.]